jgi:hypothetical protein
MDGFTDRPRRLVANDTQLREARNAGADRQHRPLIGDFVQRRYRRCGQGRMTRVRVGHAWPEADARRVRSEVGQAGVHLAIEALVREPDLIVAAGFRNLRLIDQVFEGVMAQ